MGLKICSFASGSRGNSIFVCSESTKILVDVGISNKRVCEGINALRENTENVSVLLTHTHADHIGQLPTFAKKNSPIVYCHYLSTEAVVENLPFYSRIAEFDEDFFIGDITVSPFRVSHDVPCVGFSFYNNGNKISIVTDIGMMSDDILSRISDSHIVLIEANHDIDTLKANPNYSYSLKRRILSDKGHLSNNDCALAVSKMATCGVRQFLLAHLSAENNSPQKAYAAVSEGLRAAGFAEGEVGVGVLQQNCLSRVYEVSHEKKLSSF